MIAVFAIPIYYNNQFLRKLMIFERVVLCPEVEDKIFKRFSRSRANKLRHMGPRYNTSQIIYKVRRQWAMMNDSQKLDFFRFDKQIHPNQDQQDLKNNQFSNFISQWNKQREKHIQQVNKKRQQRQANKIIVFSQNTKKWNPCRASQMQARFEEFNDSDFEREQKRIIEFSQSQSQIGDNIKKKRQSKQKKPLKQSKVEVLRRIQTQYIESIKRHEEVLQCVRKLNEIDPEFVVMLRGIVIDVDSYDDFKKQKVYGKKQQNNVQEEKQQNHVQVESKQKENQTQNEKIQQHNQKVQPLSPNRFGDQAAVDLMFQYPSVFKKVIIGKNDPQYQQQKQIIRKAKQSYSCIRIKRLRQLTKQVRKKHPRWSANQVATIVKLIEKKRQIQQKSIFDEACKKVYRSRILMKKALCGKIVSNKINHQKRCSKCIQQNMFNNSTEKIVIQKSNIRRRSMVDTRSSEYVELTDQHKPKLMKQVDPAKSQKRKLIWKQRKQKKNLRMRGLKK